MPTKRLPRLLLVLMAATALLLAGGAARAESDLVAHFYAAEAAGVVADRLSLSERQLSSDARDRLRDHGGLSWSTLSGLQQRALLWDAGLVVTSPTSGPAQILTACSLSMSDIMLDVQVVRQLVATAANRSSSAVCELSRCGGNAAFLERCVTDAIVSATRCVIDTATLSDLATTSTPGAFWAEDGGSDALAAPILREHSSANATARLFAIHVTDAAFVGEQACETSGRIIIPCRAKTASDVGLCTPAKGGTLDAWLRFASVPPASAFSTTSAALLIVALGICAVQAGALYYVIQYKLRRKDSADDSDADSQTSELLSREQLLLRDGASPMEMFTHAHGTNPTVSNDTLCATSPILRRFVADPQVVTKRISAHQLTFLRVLSKGGNGEVWLGQYESRYVALKYLLLAKRADVAALERFTDEIRLASVLEHPRIVGFCGVAWQSLLHLCAVTEYMERGDLETVLSHAGAASLTWQHEKLRLAADIAEALVYLHSLAPVIIHRDLKSKNVLLDRRLRAKLSDFGLSRETSVEDTLTNGVGTILWSAPEVLEGKRYDEKADMFSFGIVLSEIDTCMLPYGFNKDRTKNKMKSMQIVHLVSEGKLLPTFRDDCPPLIVELARECLELDPAKRPTAMEAIFRLRAKIFPLLNPVETNDFNSGFGSTSG